MRKVRDPLTKRFTRLNPPLEEATSNDNGKDNEKDKEKGTHRHKPFLFLESKYLSETIRGRREKNCRGNDDIYAMLIDKNEEEGEEAASLARPVDNLDSESESDVDYHYYDSEFAVIHPDVAFSPQYTSQGQGHGDQSSTSSASCNGNARDRELIPLLRKLASSSTAMKNQVLRKTQRWKSYQLANQRRLSQLKEDFALFVQPINARLASENDGMRQEHEQARASASF